MPVLNAGGYNKVELRLLEFLKLTRRLWYLKTKLLVLISRKTRLFALKYVSERCSWFRNPLVINDHQFTVIYCLQNL